MKQRTAALLLIGKLAALVGMKPDSVRFYERAGLLPKPQRLTSGYRVYDEAALKRLRFIRQAQSLGFSLDEIHRILNLRGQGKETCRCVIGMAEATLSETEERLAEWQTFADSLRAHLRRWKRNVDPGACTAAEFCNLIESTAREPRKGQRRSRIPKLPPSAFTQ
ncbi:MAG: heavy metal-responsive transcriptional regulator [Verrucomicrobia bacterium]|nr:heavy metal-responsive transcriptional regulator [Verrucomicrobiota bacterium]